jgi:hypothetical protein
MVDEDTAAAEYEPPPEARERSSTIYQVLTYRE